MSGVLAVLLIFIVAVGAWWVDVRIFHPWKTCPRCGGDRRLKGAIPRTHGDCKRCGSTGRVRRFGARKQ